MRDGRQQVEALVRRSPRAARFTVAQTYRVEDMMDVRLLAASATAGRARRARLQTVRVRFHVPAGGEGLRASLLRRLRARFPEATITDDAGHVEKVAGDGGSDGAESGAEALSFVATLSVQDSVSIFPWLRTFHPHAEILAGADGLRARMKEDLEEALRHYEG